MGVTPHGLWTAQTQSRDAWIAHLVLTVAFGVLLLVFCGFCFVHGSDAKDCSDSIETCSGWQEMSLRQKYWYSNDQSKYADKAERNGFAAGGFSFVAAVLCLLN